MRRARARVVVVRAQDGTWAIVVDGSPIREGMARVDACYRRKRLLNAFTADDQRRR